MSNQHERKPLTLTDLDNIWFLHLPIVSFSNICCMASELEPAKFWLIPWYLINHNFEYENIHDLRFASLLAYKMWYNWDEPE